MTRRRPNFRDEIWLSVSYAINVFIKAAIRGNRMPFQIEGAHRPNAETMAAKEEG